MAQILVRDLDEATVAALKRRAKVNNRSLQGEVRAILGQVVEDERRGREFRATLDKWRERWRVEGRTFSDSAEIIRELRDRE